MNRVPPWLLASPIAHRGLHDRAHGRVENSLSAARAAAEAGYAVECDVQLSSDGEAMVFHDHALDRLTGAAGPLGERTSAELGRIALGGTTDLVPTLAELLDAIGGRVPLVVEVKSRFAGDERLARRTVEVLTGRPDLPVAVKSFDPAIVSLIRRISPALPRGIVGQARYDGPEEASLGEEKRHAMANLLHWADTEPDFLSWRHTDLPGAATFLPRRLSGVPVMTWTIRSQDQAASARAHADQIVFEGFNPA